MNYQFKFECVIHTGSWLKQLIQAPPQVHFAKITSCIKLGAAQGTPPKIRTDQKNQTYFSEYGKEQPCKFITII